MIGRSSIVVPLLFLAASASAQQVQIRSGEHETFTRLAFDFPQRIEWSLEQAEGSAVLKFSGSEVSLNANSVFSRITRERVTNVTIGKEDPSVEISLGCLCSVEAYWYGRSMLVIDIKDDQGSIERHDAIELDLPGLSPETLVAEQDPHLDMPSNPDLRFSPVLRLPLGTLEKLAEDKENPESDPTENAPQVRSIAVAETRDQLLLELGRAATQGLLTPVTPSGLDRPATPISPQTDEESSIAHVEETGPPVRQTLPHNIQIDVRTAIDEGFLSALTDQSGPAETAFCLSDERVDVASWGTDAPFWEQIGPLRSSLTGEFDRTNAARAKDLVRSYLFFGFGLEAQNYIDLLPEDSEDKPVFLALSEIMEHGQARETVLARQTDCSGVASFWSAMSYNRLPSDASIDGDAILRGFSALPPHLRSHLGPGLSRRFLDADMKRESSKVLRILDRNSGLPNPEAEFVEAELEIANGDEPAAQEQLTSVVEANGTQAAEALVRRIDRLLERDETVSFDLAQLASSYAFEFADSPISQDLSRVHILALGASEAFDEAFSELDRAQPTLQDLAPAVRAQLSGLLVEKAEQMEFLRHVFAGRTGDPAFMKPSAQLQFARRLVDLGFEDEAAQMIAAPLTGSFEREAKLLRAEIALSRGLPRQAEVELLGITDDDANRLRGVARSMIGEHAQAAELFGAAGMTQAAEREAWLAKDWAPDLDSPDSSAANGSLDDADDASAALGELSKNRSLVASASKTREELLKLLNATAAPEAIETEF